MSSIDRLHSGVFECRDCAARYDIQDASEDELFCLECGGTLMLSDDDDATEDESEN
jgi:transcription initiation factor IIE alpha subunit